MLLGQWFCVPNSITSLPRHLAHRAGALAQLFSKEYQITHHDAENFAPPHKNKSSLRYACTSVKPAAWACATVAGWCHLGYALAKSKHRNPPHLAEEFEVAFLLPERPAYSEAIVPQVDTRPRCARLAFRELSPFSALGLLGCSGARRPARRLRGADGAAQAARDITVSVTTCSRDQTVVCGSKTLVSTIWRPLAARHKE